MYLKRKIVLIGILIKEKYNYGKIFYTWKILLYVIFQGVVWMLL